jgi:hypothetical protein
LPFLLDVHLDVSFHKRGGSAPILIACSHATNKLALLACLRVTQDSGRHLTFGSWAPQIPSRPLLEGDDRRGHEIGAWCGECTEPLFRLVSSAGAMGGTLLHLHLHLTVSQNSFVRKGTVVDAHMLRVFG